MHCRKCRIPRPLLWRALALAIAQIALALVIATSADPAHANDAVAGDWHGQVHSPAGPLTVIVTLEQTGSGAWEAGFQVPSQAPGVIIATEAAAAVEWLAQQPEIKNDAIGLIGHSEGGLVAPITAGDTSDVAWVVLLAAIRSLLEDHRDATIIELPGLNHLFQTAGTGDLGEYRDIEETIAPAALELIGRWIARRSSAPVDA